MKQSILFIHPGSKFFLSACPIPSMSILAYLSFPTAIHRSTYLSCLSIFSISSSIYLSFYPSSFYPVRLPSLSIYLSCLVACLCIYSVSRYFFLFFLSMQSLLCSIEIYSIYLSIMSCSIGIYSIYLSIMSWKLPPAATWVWYCLISRNSLHRLRRQHDDRAIDDASYETKHSFHTTR